MTQAIKISKKSVTKFKTNNIVNMATEFVKNSINMKKVKGAIKDCLKQHPELLAHEEFTEVVMARILAQSVLNTKFGDRHTVLWKDTATRKQKNAMEHYAFHMFYICKEHGV